MTKSSKTTTATATPPAASADRDALFTAHQVHTLAQLTYQRLAQGTNPPVGADGGPQTGRSDRTPASGPTTVGQAMSGHPLPPTCFYWYA